MENKLNAALGLAARGFKVFPIKPGAKAPPLLSDWPAKATCDRDVIAALWGKWPEANIGIHCDGLMVLDVDTKKGGDATLDTLALMDDMPPTLVSRTPSGGRHVFYRLPDGHPGVPNSVEALGPGLDVRSTHGYVVAPGSETKAGVYAFESGQAVEAAPGWLIPKLGIAVPKSGIPNAPVLDAPDAIVERARTWLIGQLPAIEGHGGDKHTFTVAAGLRDRGVSEEQAVGLMLMWNQTCQPPWGEDELRAKVTNAYAYARNEPAAKVALPSDFPNVGSSAQVPTVSHDPPVSTIVNTPAPGARAIRFSEFTHGAAKGAGYLIKGMFNRASYSEIYGESGAGKTFLALDMSYHVAAGKPWMGRKVHQGLVLYLAYEGIGGLEKRIQSLHRHYGAADVPFYVYPADFNLREKEGRQALGCVLGTLPAKPALIVIDTFALALRGGDENSAQDVGAFNNAVQELTRATGACVLILHHPGKNKTAGARGSSALRGAVDTELEVDNHCIYPSKQRDIELGEPIGFKLSTVDIGTDDDGDSITSCVVLPAKARAPGSGANNLKGNNLAGWETLCLMSPTNTPVSIDDWKEKCKDFLGNGPSLRQRFSAVKRALEGRHMIVVEKDNVTRKLI